MVPPHIGGERCPIVDTWWQTETGGIMISPLPGRHATKPGSARSRCPGIGGRGRRRQRQARSSVGGGWLTLTQPWPGMLRGIWGDDERYKESYWSRFPGKYLAGDDARSTTTATSGSWAGSTT